MARLARFFVWKREVHRLADLQLELNRLAVTLLQSDRSKHCVSIPLALRECTKWTRSKSIKDLLKLFFSFCEALEDLWLDCLELL